MAGRSNLSIVTLNAKGIATVSKRAKIFHLLPIIKADIYFLQETNISGPNLINKAKADWPGLFFWTSGIFPIGCGVAVLVKPGLDINLKLVFDHPSGRLIVLDCRHLGLQTRLINTYCPAAVQELECSLKDVHLMSDSWSNGTEAS